LQYSNEIKKNSVPLKEELTRRRANTSRGSATMRMLAHVTMRKKPALSASAFLKIAGNACVAVISLIHVRRVRCAMKARVSGATWLTALHTDSESQILQGKYFRAHRHVRSVARAQRRRCCESSLVDSQHARRLTHARLIALR
jgi:hypothetical protein